MIDTCDAVAFLPDFRQSAGARLEYDYCLYTDKSVHHYADDAAATVSHNPSWCRCVIPYTEEAKP